MRLGEVAERKRHKIVQLQLQSKNPEFPSPQPSPYFPLNAGNRGEGEIVSSAAFH